MPLQWMCRIFPIVAVVVLFAVCANVVVVVHSSISFSPQWQQQQQQQQQWQFSLNQIPPILLQQISLQQTPFQNLQQPEYQQQQQQLMSQQSWHDSYTEYMSRLTDYYTDYYNQYGTKYNEYLEKFTEWLMTNFGVTSPSSASLNNNNNNKGQQNNNGNGGRPSPSTINGGNGNGTPNQQQGETGDATKANNSSSTSTSSYFHRRPHTNNNLLHRPLCAPRTFPPPLLPFANNNSQAEPTFAHPLVLPVLYGNFTARNNPGKTIVKNGSSATVDAQHQHLAMHSSVTLVVDHDGEGTRHIIVVDTGLAVMKHALMRGIFSNGIQPHQVDTVCITHPDTDTMGNLNLFPCAEIHSGNAISRENLFARQTPPLFESARSELPFRRLFVHTELFLTPGMSFQDQSLLVHNVPNHGTVAIVGKLILNENDLVNNLAIREFAVEDLEHRKLWQATRREIVCMADYIVPGYGAPFKISAEVKRLAECGTNKKTDVEQKKSVVAIETPFFGAARKQQQRMVRSTATSSDQKLKKVHKIG